MTPLEIFRVDPPIRIDELRTIFTAADAIALLRDHESRPGVDDRDEVLHQIERAPNDEALGRALARFRTWVQEGGPSLPTPTNTAAKRRSGQPPRRG